MSPASPPVDHGNVVGNVYDKYGTKNPIARLLVDRFLKSVTELYSLARPATVLEVGCGEGMLALHLLRSGPRPDRFVASDVELDRVTPGLDPAIEIREASIYALPFAAREFDLVVCCEVLEHLGNPALGLSELSRVARRHVLLSTPREPIWRMLNVARGRYLGDLGNTPGHIQHFSRRGLTRLAETRLHVLQRRSPLPWTVLLGEPRVG